MLRTRVITALILAPGIIAAIYLLNTTALGAVLAIFTGLAAWEWGLLAGMQSTTLRLTYVCAALLVTLLLWIIGMATAVLWLLVLVWITALVAVLTWPESGSWIAKPVVVGSIGLLVLAGVVIALLTVHQLPSGPHWLLFGLLICWAADIGAYFAGKAFGRHKLAVEVSPGKTWEGAMGGLLLALAVCSSILVYEGVFDWIWIPVLALLVAISIIGDLFESLLKRASGIKDSGSLFPGHGGVLDRIDSILAVAPFYALWLLGALVVLQQPV
ncbi:MAG: phosphatidate cytidylyltransferase [Gammaproteobacteria bacterium]|nr:phosphatidate cytidylyltransferase [Gammaproteobacteria bacterium]